MTIKIEILARFGNILKLQHQWKDGQWFMTKMLSGFQVWKVFIDNHDSLSPCRKGKQINTYKSAHDFWQTNYNAEISTFINKLR